MKFVKSNFAQKLIIILIALMIFNIVIPKEVKAWDLGGILLKPITSLILASMVSTDVSIGILLNGISIAIGGIGGIIELFTEDNAEGLKGLSTALNQLFIGPDAIFAGRVKILDANIFEVKSYTGVIDFVKQLKDSQFKDSLNDITEVASPGYNLVVSLKEGIATVYIVLRNICGYIMLAGLIFTGIRVLISSNIPTKKTMYLMLLQDWLIGMVLLIFSHVIMVGVFYISDTLVEALANDLMGVGGLNFNIIIQCLSSFDSAEQIICLVMLGYLIYLTIVFGISYLKRLMWICVLVVIAPVVSVMYAFGNSTKSIYTKWLREYMTTVLVQPFHMIVYYILVAIPLNISNSTRGFSLTGGNFLEIIYCLVAISFIRPAEKYIRDLFGMSQGVVAQASFDSGKQTLDKAIKAVTTVAVTAGTAGLGGAAMATLKGGSLLKGVAGASKGLLGNGALGKAGGKVIDTAAGGLEKGGDLAKNILFGKDSKSAVIDSGQAQPKTPVKSEEDPEEVKEKLVNTDSNPKKENIDSNFRKEDTDVDSKKENIDSNINTASDIKTKDEENNKKTAENADRLELDFATANINLNSANINLGQVNGLSDNDGAEEIKENKKEETNERSIEKDDNTATDIEENEKNIKFVSDETEEVKLTKDGEEKPDDNEDTSKDKKSVREKLMDTAERKAGDMASFMKLATGQQGVFDSLKGINRDTKVGEALGGLADKFSGSEFGKSLEKFESLGGFEQLHQGFNEVRDTFYVSAPPQDWKETNTRMEKLKKDKDDQNIFNIENNEGAQQYIIKNENLIKKYRDMYPDKKKYPDARINDMAKTKAKERLKTLATTYVPYGITDYKVMKEIDDDRKTYGLTVQGAIEQRVSYERFNSDPNNVNSIRESDLSGTGTYNRVSDAIDDDDNHGRTREYFNAGYNNADDMLRVRGINTLLDVEPQKAIEIDRTYQGGSKDYFDPHDITRAYELTNMLKVSPEFGMQLDKALRSRGGNIDLSSRNDLTKETKEYINKFISEKYSSDKGAKK